MGLILTYNHEFSNIYAADDFSLKLSASRNMLPPSMIFTNMCVCASNSDLRKATLELVTSKNEA